MHLSTYLCVNEITQTQLAKACGVSVNSANRWVNGQHVPAPEMMVRIYVWTNGQVRPDDFYDLPDLAASDAAFQSGSADDGALCQDAPSEPGAGAPPTVPGSTPPDKTPLELAIGEAA